MVELEDSEDFSLEEADQAVLVDNPGSFAQQVSRQVGDWLAANPLPVGQSPKLSYELLRKKPHLYSRVTIGSHKVLVYRLNWLKEDQDGV